MEKSEMKPQSKNDLKEAKKAYKKFVLSRGKELEKTRAKTLGRILEKGTPRFGSMSIRPLM